MIDESDLLSISLKRNMRCEDHPDFSVYNGMLSRCRPGNAGSKNYADRGIKVCRRWVKGGFWVFNQDMGDRPSPAHSIDRINNDGDYEPANCRWVTAKEQCNNRRTNRFITFNDKTMTMSQWADHIGISYTSMKRRFELGWSVEKALSHGKLGAKLNGSMITKMVEMRLNGHSVEAISKAFGVSKSSVSCACQSAGIIKYSIDSRRHSKLANLPPLKWPA